MNAPQTVAPPDALIGEALGRFAEAAARAGHAEWTPPAVRIASARLQRAIDFEALSRPEALTVALLLAVECDASVARRVAAVQAPVAGARVLAGLAASLFAAEQLSVAGLWSGKAARAGLIVWGDEALPLPERSLSMPPWLVAAFSGFDALPPGVSEPALPEVILSRDLRERSAEHARGLSGKTALLVVRAHCPAEGEAAARTVADAAGLGLCQLADATAPGLSTWLTVMERLPMVHRQAAPGETIDLAGFDAVRSPLLAVVGTDGQVASSRRHIECRAAIPSEAERSELWRGWGLGADEAQAAAARYRQGAGRIAELGRALGDAASLDRLAEVMQANGGRIDALARRAAAEVRREDIVLPGDLGAALDRLRDRILLRNRLHEGLGSTISARYKPGVRALLTGESGTGKTLAVHWLAHEAGLPLYRVDLAALTSKWIGETEKNLSQLLDTAEQGDVVLFFDEADSLFGARTDVADAHDRYANSQTNFLLQRIEDYEGVALLATNSRDRFDPAFVRRLDMVLQFPLPDAAARRLLWDRHLGAAHAVSSTQLDTVAATVDLAGGHVRNIVLAAAARAKAVGRPIALHDLIAATDEEYGKLGRTAPPLPQG